MSLLRAYTLIRDSHHILMPSTTEKKAPAAPMLTEALSFGECKRGTFATQQQLHAFYEAFATKLTGVKRADL